jgi:putative membrane protein
VTRCERLFSSPIPPNMARHGMRSLVLQLLLLPVVLAGTMPPLAVAATVAVTSYIYVGIDELGVQAEPPRSSSSPRPPGSTLATPSWLHPPNALLTPP